MRFSFYFGVGIVVLFFIFIVLNSIGYNALWLTVATIEWSTKYILPWIVLYWFIQFVKNKR